MNVLVYVLEAIVAHASEEEPRSDVLVLLFRDRLLTLCSTIDEDCGEVTGELSLVLGNQTPLGIFLRFRSF